MNKLILSAVLLLLISNVVVLAGVAYNRSGEPTGTIILTERELRVERHRSRSDENSGMALAIKWEAPGNSFIYNRKNKYISEIYWLNEEKLKTFGVDVDGIKKNYKNIDDKDYVYGNRLESIDAILVLEYDGEAYKKAVDKANKILDEAIAEDKEDSSIEYKESRCESIKTTDTRLYVIDAGTDIDELQGKYKGDNKYLFMRGEIKVLYDEDSHEVYGRIRQVFIKRIHVPLPYSKFIEKRISNGEYNSYNSDINSPRYKVELNIGKRLEPWIMEVRDF